MKNEQILITNFVQRYSDGLWIGQPRALFPEMQDFSLHLSIQTGSETHPASYPMGIGEGGTLVPVTQLLGREADHSPPSSAEVELYLYVPNVFMA
jgi:hypothetical protein